MIYLLALIPATALVIAGYFVWYFSAKSEDKLKSTGKYIAIWCFILAAFVGVAGITMSVMRVFMPHHGGHHMMHHGMGGMRGGPGGMMGRHFGPGMGRGQGMGGMGMGGMGMGGFAGKGMGGFNGRKAL